MKSFAIHNGDLVVGKGGYETVDGAARVQQDLGLAVREPYGIDRFHPRWGSVLDNYIGMVIDPNTPVLVEAEIRRTIQNYVAIQQFQLQQDATAGGKSRYDGDEVIIRVNHVSITQYLDHLRVEAIVGTLGNQPVVVDATVGV